MPPTLDHVCRKFGEVAEAAQIVETDLGTMLLFCGVVDEGLITPTLQVDTAAAAEVLRRINRQTLGQLLKNTKRHTDSLDQLEPLRSKALEERNRLAHSFYRQHNFRRNSEAGRAVMMKDLETIHETLLEAMKALSLYRALTWSSLSSKRTRRALLTGIHQTPAMRSRPFMFPSSEDQTTAGPVHR